MKTQKQPEKLRFFGAQKHKPFFANQRPAARKNPKSFAGLRKFRGFSRKSQLYSQIFIYILSIILISFILFYGYNAVQNFKKRAEQVCLLKLRSDVVNAVESISSDFGSIKRKDMELCAGYSQVCFVETLESPVLPNDADPIIKDSVLSDAGKNVFLVEKIAKESFYAGKISVEPDVMCIKAANNKVSIKLEGRGSHALLSQWK